MGLNQFVRDLAEKGLRTQDLLDDRPDQTEGLLWFDSWKVHIVSPAAATFTSTKTAAGDYRRQRTAAGAETHNLVVSLTDLVRLQPVKGLRVIDVAFAYRITTVDATSVDVVVNQTTYADRSGPTVSSYGGTGTYDTNHDTAAERKASAGGSNPHLLVFTLPDGGFQVTDKTYVNSELTVVLPNTCVFQLLGAGFHLGHDYL
jgi:hypothetical protein